MALVLALSGCSTGQSSTLPIVANAHQAGTLAVGEQRMLVALVESEGNRPVGGPGTVVDFEVFYGDEPDDNATLVPGSFLWTVPDVRGLYRLDVTFDRPGTWGVIAHLPDEEPSEMALFSVVPDSPVPDVGSAAIAIATPTADDFPLHEISSDPDPDPAFYSLSLDRAIESGRPTVVVFATPAFCTSVTCGPTLDVVKGIAPDFPGVNFVHVEVYENLDAASFEDLVVAAPVTEWRLPSEPWVYVIDQDGVISDRFEGTVDEAELASALRYP